MPFVSSPVRVVPEPAAWAVSPDKNTNSNQTVPVGSDASEHELRQRDKLEALKAEAAALIRLEKQDPEVMPKPLALEAVLGTRIRYLGTAERAETFVNREDGDASRAPTPDLSDRVSGSRPMSARISLARQKTAEAKAVAKAMKENPDEMPRPSVLESVLGARLRYVGTAETAERYARRRSKEEEVADEWRKVEAERLSGGSNNGKGTEAAAHGTRVTSQRTMEAKAGRGAGTARKNTVHIACDESDPESEENGVNVVSVQ